MEEEGEGNLNVDSESLTLQRFNHGEDSGYRLKTTTTTWHCFRSISFCVLKKKKNQQHCFRNENKTTDNECEKPEHGKLEKIFCNATEAIRITIVVS